jgi:hypothetical protein
MTKKTKRIYHGPDDAPTAFWWDVEWSPATKGVIINGTLEHAIEGVPGNSIGCRLSNAAIDTKNASAFPHPVYIAAFYKRIALIVDKLAKNGTPVHAIAYEHDYGSLVDLNDLGNLEPVYKDKRFHLRAPQKHKLKKAAAAIPSNGGALDNNKLCGTESGSALPNNVEPLFHPSVAQKRVATFKGAGGRAIKAGLIGRSAMAQLARAVKKSG